MSHPTRSEDTKRPWDLLDPLVRERIEKSMNFEEGDRVPIWDFIDNRAIYRHFAGDEPEVCVGMPAVYRELGIDLSRGHGMLFEESQEDEVGEIEGRETKISGRSLWRTEFAIETLADLRSYEPPVADEADIEANWLPNYLRTGERFAPYTLFVPCGGMGLHWMRGQMGLELFSMAIYDARDDLERVLAAASEYYHTQARVAARHNVCPLYFMGDDIAYKGATMFSPQFLREAFIPRLAHVCEPLKNAGIKVIFHSDGYVMEILDDMVEAGIDGLNPIEPLSGMDIGYLKRRYGRNLILVGNVDPSHLLPKGTVKDVIEATKDCLRAAAPGGGHFVGSGGEIGPSVPLQNILAFYEACREYGKYPIRV